MRKEIFDLRKLFFGVQIRHLKNLRYAAEAFSLNNDVHILQFFAS